MSNISCEKKRNRQVFTEVVTEYQSTSDLKWYQWPVQSQSHLDVGETDKKLVHPGEGVSGVELPSAGTLTLGEVRVHLRSVLLEAVSEEARNKGYSYGSLLGKLI